MDIYKKLGWAGKDAFMQALDGYVIHAQNLKKAKVFLDQFHPDSFMEIVHALKQVIKAQEKEIADLKAQLARYEKPDA